MSEPNLPLRVPGHVAVIMDGNGRWAKQRKMPRTAGHKAGVDAARRAVRAAGEAGVKYFTLFGFSNENWARPKTEISDLMGLLRLYLSSEADELKRNNVCLRVIGRRDRLPVDIMRVIEKCEAATKDNDGLFLTIALDYGGRQDIVQAVQKLVDQGVTHIDEEAIEGALLTAGLPAPDLMIRTSGEQRISNFLLWQCAYSEFMFMDVLWPDFGAEHFMAALQEYANRQRRFGGLDGESDRAVQAC